ncbi:Mth938-like domain-containing protein [Metallibacterium scheffleri]
MELSLQRPGNWLYVRHVGADSITVVDRELRQSFLLCRDQAVENWPVRDVTALLPEHWDAVLALQPEVVLLGTGAQQQFPQPATLATLLQRGIGCEVMHNAACARTYTVLSDEGRRVVAAFILPG